MEFRQSTNGQRKVRNTHCPSLLLCENSAYPFFLRGSKSRSVLLFMCCSLNIWLCMYTNMSEELVAWICVCEIKAWTAVLGQRLCVCDFLHRLSSGGKPFMKASDVGGHTLRETSFHFLHLSHIILLTGSPSV